MHHNRSVLPAQAACLAAAPDSADAAMRRQCVAQFSEWYGADLLQTQQVDWKADGRGGWLSRPMCRLTSLGCVYL